MFSKVKTLDYRLLLAVDPASTSGVALFNIRTGELIDVITIKAEGKWGVRVNKITSEIKEYFAQYLPYVEYYTFEQNQKSSMILNGIGVAISGCVPNAFVSDKVSGVAPTSWKAWWRRTTGLKDSSPKGVDALAVISPEYAEMCDNSEDASDAVMIGMYWLAERKGKLI